MNNMKELQEMSDTEKKKFFSMDLAERMIRVEQKVSASFNKYVPYYQTEYYKSMTEKQKTDFRKHLRNKKRRRVLFVFFILIPVFLLGLFRLEVTGKVVVDTVGENNSLNIQIFLIILFVLIVIYSIYLAFSRRSSNKRFSNNFKIIEDILSNKRTKK